MTNRSFTSEFSVIGRAPIVDRMHVAHRCEELARIATEPLDTETVIIIRGDDEEWYVQDLTHRPLCRTVHCLGCGRHLENELRHLTHLMSGVPSSLRLPILRGLL